MEKIPEFELYCLIAGCKIDIPLMQTMAPSPEAAAKNLFCELANPKGKSPWVVIVPDYLKRILRNIVIGAGGFDGEEIYYLIKAEKNNNKEESIGQLLSPFLTTAILRNLANYIREQKQLPYIERF